MARESVNAPLNPQLKEKDINRKLQYYGIYSAFKAGKVPSNKQIDIALNSLLHSEALTTPSNDLSDDGRKIISDLRSVIINARNLILVKNQDNVLQEFIWDTETFEKPQTQTPGRPVEKDEARQHGRQVADGFRTLGTLLVTNGQFRKLLNDATLLLRDIASDSAQKAAGAMKPSEEQLAQIDRPADENVWHEKPKLPKGAKDTMSSLRSRSKGKETEKMNGGVSSAVDGAVVRDTGTMPSEQEPAEAETAETSPAQAKANAKSRELAQRTKNFLAEKMPRERREQTIWRLKRMLVEIQGHSDYQQAIETLLSVAETYAEHTQKLARAGVDSARGAREESDLKKLESKIRILVERFANSTSLDDLFESINKLYRDADNDPRLKDWFKSINNFIRRCLREEGFVLQDEANEKWRSLYDEGNFLLRDRYRDDTNRFAGEIRFMADQFNQDPLNRAFSQSLQRLFYDLGHDTEGKMIFKSDLMKDFTKIILPAIFEHVQYVPIPRIEVSDPMVDVVIENLAVESDNLMPNVVEFGSDNYWRWGRKHIGNKHDNKILISAMGIQTDWKDVSYYIKKKTGFPTIKDKGVMDVFMGGEGFSFRILGSASQEQGEQKYFVKPEKVSVSVKNLDIRLKKSKHKFLFTMFKPLLFSLVRPAVEKALEKQIRDSFTKADAFARLIYDEAKRTRATALEDPEDKRSMYQHYASALRTKMMERKKQAEEVAEAKEKRDTKVNVAPTQRESIFANIQFPAGISSKATEYKELSEKGERWESPVFDIGSASESVNLPRLAPITRKPHETVVKTREQEAAERAARRAAPEPEPFDSDWASGEAGPAGPIIDGAPLAGTADEGVGPTHITVGQPSF